MDQSAIKTILDFLTNFIEYSKDPITLDYIQEPVIIANHPTRNLTVYEFNTAKRYFSTRLPKDFSELTQIYNETKDLEDRFQEIIRSDNMDGHRAELYNIETELHKAISTLSLLDINHPSYSEFFQWVIREHNINIPPSRPCPITRQMLPKLVILQDIKIYSGIMALVLRNYFLYELNKNPNLSLEFFNQLFKFNKIFKKIALSTEEIKSINTIISYIFDLNTLNGDIEAQHDEELKYNPISYVTYLIISGKASESDSDINKKFISLQSWQLEVLNGINPLANNLSINFLDNNSLIYHEFVNANNLQLYNFKELYCVAKDKYTSFTINAYSQDEKSSSSSDDELTSPDYTVTNYIKNCDLTYNKYVEKLKRIFDSKNLEAGYNRCLFAMEGSNVYYSSYSTAIRALLTNRLLSENHRDGLNLKKLIGLTKYIENESKHLTFNNFVDMVALALHKIQRYQNIKYFYNKFLQVPAGNLQQVHGSKLNLPIIKKYLKQYLNHREKIIKILEDRINIEEFDELVKKLLSFKDNDIAFINQDLFEISQQQYLKHQDNLINKFFNILGVIDQIINDLPHQNILNGKMLYCDIGRNDIPTSNEDDVDIIIDTLIDDVVHINNTKITNKHIIIDSEHEYIDKIITDNFIVNECIIDFLNEYLKGFVPQDILDEFKNNKNINLQNPTINATWIKKNILEEIESIKKNAIEMIIVAISKDPANDNKIQDNNFINKCLNVFEAKLHELIGTNKIQNNIFSNNVYNFIEYPNGKLRITNNSQSHPDLPHLNLPKYIPVIVPDKSLCESEDSLLIPVALTLNFNECYIPNACLGALNAIKSSLPEMSMNNVTLSLCIQSNLWRDVDYYLRPSEVIIPSSPNQINAYNLYAAIFGLNQGNLYGYKYNLPVDSKGLYSKIPIYTEINNEKTHSFYSVCVNPEKDKVDITLHTLLDETTLSILDYHLCTYKYKHSHNNKITLTELLEIFEEVNQNEISLNKIPLDTIQQIIGTIPYMDDLQVEDHNFYELSRLTIQDYYQRLLERIPNLVRNSPASDNSKVPSPPL